MAKSAYPTAPRLAHDHARRWTERDIVTRRGEFVSSGFTSIIASIIISLAVKFAVALLISWLKEEFNEQPERE